MYSKIAILAILAISLPSAAFASDEGAPIPGGEIAAPNVKANALMSSNTSQLPNVIQRRAALRKYLGVPPDADFNKVTVQSLTGKAQILKNNVPTMEMDENSPLPATLDAGVKFKMLTGKGVFSTPLLTITGAAGSEFTLTGTQDATRVIAGAGTPIEAKDKLGNSYVFTENSDATFGLSDNGFGAAVNQGRLLQSNSKGETSIVGSGESLVLMPLQQTPIGDQERPASTAKPKTPATTGESILTQIIPPAPATNVIPTKEEAESEHVISRSAP